MKTILLQNFQASTSCPSDNTSINIYTNMEQRWQLSAAEDPTNSTNIKNKSNIQFMTHREHLVHHKDKLVDTVGGNNSYLFANGTNSINILCVQNAYTYSVKTGGS